MRQYFCGPPLRRRFFGEPRAIPSHAVETQVPTAVISLLHKNRLIWFPNYAFARDSTARYLPLLFSKAFDFPQNWLDLLRRVMLQNLSKREKCVTWRLNGAIVDRKKSTDNLVPRQRSFLCTFVSPV